MGAETPLLLFFFDPQSGPARRMESLLAHLARKERQRLRVAQVDIDARRDLVEKMKVQSAPTLVLVKDRRIVARIEGRASAPQIEALIAEHVEPVAEPV